jgi:hypothetical protein
VHFWTTRTEVAGEVAAWARAVDLGPAVESAPLPVLGEIILSLFHAPGDQFERLVARYHERIMARYREGTETLWIEETDDLRRAHFVVPVEVLGGEMERLTGPRSSGDALFDRARSRMELLRQLAPGRSLYGTQGYGHRLGLVDLPYDPTHFPGVSIRYLQPRWLPSTNATLGNLAKLVERPATWREYAETLLKLREDARTSLEQLRRGLFSHFRTDKPVPLFDRHVDRATWQRTLRRAERYPSLPRCAVDEWGFVAEGIERALGGPGAGQQSGPERARAAFLLDRYGPLLKNVRDLVLPLANFFRQAVPFLAVNALLPRSPLAQRRRMLMALVEPQGAKTDDGFLSTYNLSEAWHHLTAFQVEFRARFGHLIGGARLARLESAEAALFEKVWCLWYQLYAHPERRWGDPEQAAVTEFRGVLNRIRRQLLGALQALPQERFRTEVTTESVAWEGRPALWLRIDVTEPLEQYTGLEKVVEVFRAVLGAVQLRSPEQFALETYWGTIVVVPVIDGSNLEGIVWRFHPFSFYGGQELGERHWAMLPTLLPDSAAAEVGIPVLRHPHVQPVRAVQTAHAELWTLVAHLADLRHLPDNVDDAGFGAVQQYASEIAERIEGAQQRFMETWLSLYQEVLEDENFMDRPLLAEIHELLLSLRPCFRPVPDAEDGNEIRLEDLSDWSERLLGASSTLEAIRLFRTADLLAHPTPGFAQG